MNDMGVQTSSQITSNNSEFLTPEFPCSVITNEIK